jgi:putative tryptophan/tyrosine transport system substrate-binding protein
MTLRARAQRRIGVLANLAVDDQVGRARLAAFARGLQEAGWAEGRNVEIDTRWAVQAGQFPQYAAELVALKPDVILAITTPAVIASQKASRARRRVAISAVAAARGTRSTPKVATPCFKL